MVHVRLVGQKRLVLCRNFPQVSLGPTDSVFGVQRVVLEGLHDPEEVLPLFLRVPGVLLPVGHRDRLQRSGLDKLAECSASGTAASETITNCRILWFNP